MKIPISLSAAALALLLAVPAGAKTPAKKQPAMNPSNIGNVSRTGQSLRYKRPSKRRAVRSNPSDVRSISRTEQSLRYRAPQQRASSKRTTKGTMKKSSR